MATLSVRDGWIDIEQDLIVGPAGSGQVNQTGGDVHAGRSVVLGGPSGASGVYDLSGGSLRTPRLTQGASGGTFQFDGGVLHADEVTFDLLNRGGTLAPGDGIGHTHVAGNLTLQGGSLAIELASGARFDTVAVDGRLELGGALDIKLLGGYRPRRRRPLADHEGRQHHRRLHEDHRRLPRRNDRREPVPGPDRGGAGGTRAVARLTFLPSPFRRGD